MARMGWKVSGLALSLALVGCARSETAGTRVVDEWQVDSTPSLVLGGEGDSVAFTRVTGATRLPDGRVLVGDLADYALHLFSPEGTFLRRFGRKGNGPGEIGYLARLMRCGDSLFTQDIDPSRISAFSLEGDFARSFRFGAGQPGRQPYATVCNADRVFLHYGWEPRTAMKGGAYRAGVPFWLTPADTTVSRELGDHPGSERYGLVIDGQFRGARPQILGKQTSIAISATRAYIGTADRFEVLAFDLAGTAVDTLRKSREPVPVTAEDIAVAREKEILSSGEKWRSRIEQDFAAHVFPATLPAYGTFIVDHGGLLWVQDFSRAQSSTTSWTVFGPDHGIRAELLLPSDLEVYEIGDDYVLGRYLDTQRGIPEVRLYRLTRR